MLRTRILEAVWPSTRSGLSVVGMVAAVPLVVVVSLLPLSVLLLLLPVVVPDEAVVTDTAGRPRSALEWLGRWFFALTAGLSALLALGLFAAEATGWLGQLTGWPATVRWPLAFLVIYGLDVLLLIGLGRVPLAYNLRNLQVRWPTTLITALAFTLVVALLVVMLAFVRGMDAMTETSGKPGNVLVLSDGAIDEAFSNLGYSDIEGKIERERVPEDRTGKVAVKLAVPVEVKKGNIGGREEYYVSRETFAMANQPIPNTKDRRRFVQIRGVVDPEVSAAVHDVELLPGGRWFTTTGEKEVVLGEGVATVLGGDQGKKILEPGDTFPLGAHNWRVAGVMKAEGSTFGSEVWMKQRTVSEEFRKESYTTCVLRAADHPTLDKDKAAAVLAVWLRNEFSPKVSATTEKEYFAKLGATSRQFSVAIWFVAGFMAIGGVFGIMNTMFAAIAQRTRDIGVLRILGFKRWQILVSFMLESLAIALVGGLLGVLLGSFCNGFTASSIISGGQGGGKSVVLKLTVDAGLVLSAIVFTLVMGRLGGLVPAMSAMRLKILDSLR